MSGEEFEERKTTTITKTGLSVELTRTSKGTYKWTIQVDVPGLDEEELLKRLDRIDKALRRRFLKGGEEVEEKEEIIEETPLKTIPLQIKRRGRRSKLFGRVAVYEDKVVVEPLNPLLIRDGAIGWFIGYLEGKFGKERVDVEKTPSLERFKRIIIRGKLSDQDLREVQRKAAWGFEKAMEREEAEKA